MKANNFDVLRRMSEENKNIALCPDVLSMNYSAKSKGTRVEVGVPGNPIIDILRGKRRAVLLIWDIAEFDEMKARIEAE